MNAVMGDQAVLLLLLLLLPKTLLLRVQKVLLLLLLLLPKTLLLRVRKGQRWKESEASWDGGGPVDWNERSEGGTCTKRDGSILLFACARARNVGECAGKRRSCQTF